MFFCTVKFSISSTFMNFFHPPSGAHFWTIYTGVTVHSKYSKCHKKWEKIFSMPKNPLKPIYGQYVVGLEPFGTFKSGFGCYHRSILVLRVRKAVKMGNFAYFSFLDYQSSKSLVLWSRCVWMGSYEGDWSTLKPWSAEEARYGQNSP